MATDHTSREDITARYLVEAPAGEIDGIAQAMAVEQSVEMPLAAIRHPRVFDETVARVRSISGAGRERHVVELGLAASTVAGDPAQLLNMVFGNSSLRPTVQLLDLDLPDALVRSLGGPRAGIEGLRDLVGAHERALTCTALKPLGLTPSELAGFASTFAHAGIDVIKDDHGIADQRYAPFFERLAACQDAIERANAATGLRSRYAPSLVGSPRTLRAQARAALDAGVRIVLVAPLLVGLPAFVELREEFPDLAFIAHPAFGGAQRIVPPLLIGKLFRLYGGDAVIYPNYGGRFSYSQETCAAIADEARAPWSGVAPALPVPAGGMTVERVDGMLSFYGRDTMLLIGGALLSAGDALAARSAQFVAAVHDHRHEMKVVA